MFNLLAKLFFDLILSFILLVIFSPILIIFSLIIWFQDFSNPFYIASRVGKNGNLFNMIKFRTMIVNADKSKVDSTSLNDNRITKLGFRLRKYKIDEMPNLFNILKGEMSFVGPRPNVKRETDLYSKEEIKLHNVKPGITDFSSIVFSDEGQILKNSKDPDLDYNQLIRPWKSRLGIYYVNNNNILSDLFILYLTILSFISRKKVLIRINKYFVNKNISNNLKEILKRDSILKPYPPPGTDEVVKSRM